MTHYREVMTERPELDGILETVLYCDSSNEDEVRRFYQEVMGLHQLAFDFSYRVGSQDHVLLIFNRDVTEQQDNPPPHGATGKAHTCFTAAPGTYEEWKTYLDERGAAPHNEITWGNGMRSFYFDDPAGNVLEIAEGDFWPHD
ncbi:MAG: glyoxalase/bleomycin resistance/extradiol dioxygenase family protein [Actinomycetota bacterium]